MLGTKKLKNPIKNNRNLGNKKRPRCLEKLLSLMMSNWEDSEPVWGMDLDRQLNDLRNMSDTTDTSDSDNFTKVRKRVKRKRSQSKSPPSKSPNSQIMWLSCIPNRFQILDEAIKEIKRCKPDLSNNISFKFLNKDVLSVLCHNSRDFVMVCKPWPQDAFGGKLKLKLPHPITSEKHAEENKGFKYCINRIPLRF